MPQSIVDELGRIPMAPNLAATLVRAADLARAQAIGVVTLEHLLLALADDPDAAIILQVSAIEPAQLKADINAFLAEAGARMPPPQGAEIVVAPDLKRVLEASAAAAQQGRRREINGAIVLAAIVGDGRSAAAQILRSRGLTFEDAIKALQRAVQATQRPAPRPAAPPDVEPAGTAPSLAAPAVPIAPPPAGHPSSAPAVGAPHAPPPQAEPRTPTDDLLASVRERIAARPPVQPAAAPAAAPSEPRPYAPAASHDFEVGPAPAAAAPRIPPAAAQPPPAGFEPKWEPAGLAPAPATPNEATMPVRQGRAAPQAAGADNAPGEPGFRPTMPQGHFPRPESETRAELPRTGPPQAPAQQQLPVDRPTAPPPAMQPVPWPEPPAVRRAKPAVAGPPPAAAQHPQAARDQQPHQGAPPRLQAQRPGPSGPPATAAPPRGEPTAQSRQPGPDRRAASAVEPGQLVENIPRKMRVGVPSLVEVRIARGNVPNLAKGMAGTGAPAQRQIMVTRAMSVRMRAPDGGFFIETASPETQWIDNVQGINADDYASWRWTVTPSARGKRRLQIVVAARTVGADGLTAEAALPEQVIDVKVGVNYGVLARRSAGWILAALAGGALGKFGEGGIEALRALLRSAGVG